MKKYLIFVALSFALYSCSTTSQESYDQTLLKVQRQAAIESKSIDSLCLAMIGKHINQAYMMYGSPDEIKPDAKDGNIYTWYISTPVGDYLHYRAMRVFYANHDGIIYYYRWKGI